MMLRIDKLITLIQQEEQRIVEAKLSSVMAEMEVTRQLSDRMKKLYLEKKSWPSEEELDDIIELMDRMSELEYDVLLRLCSKSSYCVLIYCMYIASTSTNVRQAKEPHIEFIRINQYHVHAVML
eukprot:183573_1